MRLNHFILRENPMLTGSLLRQEWLPASGENKGDLQQRRGCGRTRWKEMTVDKHINVHRVTAGFNIVIVMKKYINICPCFCTAHYQIFYFFFHQCSILIAAHSQPSFQTPTSNGDDERQTPFCSPSNSLARCAFHATCVLRKGRTVWASCAPGCLRSFVSSCEWLGKGLLRLCVCLCVLVFLCVITVEVT